MLSITPPSESPGEKPDLIFRPLTPALMDDFGAVLRGSWGAGCWCMSPRLREAEMRALPGEGSLSQRRRAAMTILARREITPGLIAFEGDEPVGWIAVAPRGELTRVDRSRATPRVDDVDVWVIPCVTVRKGARGRGITVALIAAAVEYAAAHGAPAVEAYPPRQRRTDRRQQRFFRHRADVSARRVPRHPRAAVEPAPQLDSACHHAHQYADLVGPLRETISTNRVVDAAGPACGCPSRSGSPAYSTNTGVLGRRATQMCPCWPLLAHPGNAARSYGTRECPLFTPPAGAPPPAMPVVLSPSLYGRK